MVGITRSKVIWDLMIFPTEKNQFCLGISLPAGPSWQALVCWLVFVRSWISILSCWKQLEEDIYTPLLLDGNLWKIISAIGWGYWWWQWRLQQLERSCSSSQHGEPLKLGISTDFCWVVFHMSRRSFGTAGSACCWPPCITGHWFSSQELSVLSWGYRNRYHPVVMNDDRNWSKPIWWIMAQMLHVWNIYQHLP